MKKTDLVRAGMLAVALLALATPAHADIDQLCLKQCVSNGHSGGDCLNECSFGASQMPIGTAAPAKSAVNTGSSHNILKTPQPLGAQIVGTKKTTPQAPEKDYVCLTQCLHNGDAYQLCEKRCTKTQCPSGSSSSSGCSDVAHVLNGVVVNAPNPNGPDTQSSPSMPQQPQH